LQKQLVPSGIRPTEQLQQAYHGSSYSVKIEPEQLELANEKLLEMPIDALPNVTSQLPTVSLMPFQANPNFVGRVDELIELAKSLKEGTSSAITAATGIGGVGKSQLAIEFVRRYGQYLQKLRIV